MSILASSEMTPNPALQPTGYSGLRPLPPSAELRRYVQKEAMKKVFAASILLALFGCAVNPSFERSRSEMIAAVHQASVCCESISGVPFRKIQKLPYETSRLTTSSFETITHESSVYAFEGEKSRVLAFEVPEPSTARVIEFWSVSTVSHIQKGGYFSPVVRTYDENFNQTGKFEGFEFRATKEIGFQKAGVYGSVPLSAGDKYVVFHTNSRELSGYTSYIREYERSRPIEHDRDRLSPYLVTKPHLPEGAFIVSVRRT